MPWTVVEYEPTPNPNAIKCWLDHAISDGPRSFRTPADGADDALACALFEATGATTLLFCDDWLTVNKPPDATWRTVKRRIERALAAWDEPDEEAPR